MCPTGTVANAKAKEMSVHCEKSIPDPQTIRSTGLDTTHSELSHTNGTTASTTTTAVTWCNLLMVQYREEYS